eukprot:4858684-Pleurochrysis_carterae.AAC.1
MDTRWPVDIASQECLSSRATLAICLDFSTVPSISLDLRPLASSPPHDVSDRAFIEKKSSKKEIAADVISSAEGASRPSAAAARAALHHGSHTSSATDVRKSACVSGGK